MNNQQYLSIDGSQTRVPLGASNTFNIKNLKIFLSGISFLTIIGLIIWMCGLTFIQYNQYALVKSTF